MENKKYIKQMQKQIIELKKYIVQLENKLEVKELEKKVLITLLFREVSK